MTQDADFSRRSAYREEVLEGPRGAVDPVGVDGGDPEVARAPAELERLHPTAFVADEDARQFLVDLGLSHVPVAMGASSTTNDADVSLMLYTPSEPEKTNNCADRSGARRC